MNREWTTKEDATLREVWASDVHLSFCLGRFPGRTTQSIRQRAVRLNLGTSPCMRRLYEPASAGQRAIDKQLSKRRLLTTTQLVELTGLTSKYVAELLRKGSGTRYHIDGWTRSRSRGDWTPRWTLGPGDDAEKPVRKPRTEINRDYRLRKRLKQSNSPFAGLIEQVTA